MSIITKSFSKNRRQNLLGRSFDPSPHKLSAEFLLPKLSAPSSKSFLISFLKHLICRFMKIRKIWPSLTCWIFCFSFHFLSSTFNIPLWLITIDFCIFLIARLFFWNQLYSWSLSQLASHRWLSFDGLNSWSKLISTAPENCQKRKHRRFLFQSSPETLFRRLCEMFYLLILQALLLWLKLN